MKFLMSTVKLPLFITAFVLASLVCEAEVTLPKILGDNMVLQRDRAVPIWGKADPGESVTVTFAGQSKKTKAAENGNWQVQLEPMRENSTPASMTITGNNTIELKNL